MDSDVDEGEAAGKTPASARWSHTQDRDDLLTSDKDRNATVTHFFYTKLLVYFIGHHVENVKLYTIWRDVFFSHCT